jgi:hypothetical protein
VTNSLHVGPALLMPSGVIQPFPLRFRRDGTAKCRIATLPRIHGLFYNLYRRQTLPIRAAIMDQSGDGLGNLSARFQGSAWAALFF